MRLWSIHPKYLDSKGLVALWRETLLAKKVLQSNTIGYKNHPQLDRFKKLKQPVNAINYYLSEVWNESIKRDYNFNKNKFSKNFKKVRISITKGQLEYEFKHLLKKLYLRNKKRYYVIKATQSIKAHPIFKQKLGEIEDWEKIKR